MGLRIGGHGLALEKRESDLPSGRKRHEQKHSEKIRFHFSGGKASVHWKNHVRYRVYLFYFKN